MREYISQLEATLLDLGAEVCTMKSELRTMNRDNQKLQETLHALKELLDEKGILSTEDFDLALVDKTLKTSIFDELTEDTSIHSRKKVVGDTQH